MTGALQQRAQLVWVETQSVPFRYPPTLVFTRKVPGRGTGAELHLQAVDQLLQHPSEVLAQPWRPPELDGMGDLVDAHPQDELVAVHTEVARGLRQVRRQQQQARLHLGV